jgi:sulfite exporter TauE/SafE
MAELLLSALTVGFLGSLHCAGMCGPLVLAVACARVDEPAPGRVLAFLGGKLGTYVVLGAAAGVLGSALGGPAMGPRSLAGLAIAVGVFMMAMGARTLWRRFVPAGRFGPPGPVATLLSAALRTRGPLAPVLAGSLAGLLPCGLVWAMVARSLTAGTPAAGALMMAAFGLGTSPSLFATGVVSRLATGRLRRYGEVAAAVAVVAMGALVVWRGVNALLVPDGCPRCHHAV